jgi:heme oxygenase
MVGRDAADVVDRLDRDRTKVNRLITNGTSAASASRPDAGASGTEESLMAELRRRTRARHARLEQQLNTRGSGWDAQRYSLFLRMTLAVAGPLAPRVESQLGEVFAAPPPAGHAERLRADLAALESTFPPLPQVPIPPVATQAAAFGAGYVLMGSLLGGTTFMRLVRGNPGRLAGTDIPASYLEMYGPGLPSAWARFSSAVDAFARESGDSVRAEAVRTAEATFAAFGHALDRLS